MSLHTESYIMDRGSLLGFKGMNRRQRKVLSQRVIPGEAVQCSGHSICFLAPLAPPMVYAFNSNPDSAISGILPCASVKSLDNGVNSIDSVAFQGLGLARRK